uniref:ATP synthase F0 subunit 6 n=1 Tax=Dendronotus frondosus TaxID=71302 RepID=UPI002551DD2E|nr:ATP synthase F0 subunit 6 [Dendronotus frondosus]WGC92344.1 ATP synthase F0 subunit 6 [Dendronotus frondosus]
MCTDLFSALDCMQIGWMSTFLWTTPILTSGIFISSNSWGQSNSKIFLSILSTSSETNHKSLPGLPLFVFGLMGFLLLNNLLGLVPFVYGVTSNIWMAASLALIFWTLIVLSGWAKFPVESAAHLAPAGAPAALVPLLVLIETISLLIRPLTLTLRLVANISAGHIIMGLIANVLTITAIHTTALALFVHVGYNMFEVFVCFIQAYVFSLLIKLYCEEHPSH